MRPGIYMHENCMDVCIEVLKVQYQDHKRYKLRVRWWNLGYSGNPWVVPYPDQIQSVSTLEIKREDVNKWVDITNKFTTPRTKSGVPV